MHNNNRNNRKTRTWFRVGTWKNIKINVKKKCFSSFHSFQFVYEITSKRIEESTKKRHSLEKK